MKEDPRDALPVLDHEHQLGIEIDGLRRCRTKGCGYSEYNSQWGAGIFSDWPRGHHKPYGA